MASAVAKAKKSTGGLKPGRKVTGTRQATIQSVKVGTASVKSANIVTTVLSKKSHGTIEKVSAGVGANIVSSMAVGNAVANTAAVVMQHALTKSALLNKQAKKTTTRKQGGIRFGTLTQKQLKSLANRQEAMPSSAE